MNYIEKYKELKEHILKYGELLIRKSKFEMVSTFANERAKFIFSLFFLFTLLLTTLFLSAFSSLLLADYYNSFIIGTGIVAGVWLFVLFVLLIFRNPLIKYFYTSFTNQNIPK
jgi:hypothetical protein